MEPQALFELTNALALFGWILLIVLPARKNWDAAAAVIIIGFLSVCYALLLFSSFDRESFSNFSTLEGVQRLFQNPVGALAGWIHYLAFDLFVGYCIKRHSLRHGVPRLLTIPCLLLTFMVGPVGLLTYAILFSIRRLIVRPAAQTPAP